jgi:hypothetical protein
MFDQMASAPGTSEPAALDGMQAYLQRRSTSPQWRVFIAALASELFENFRPEEASGFFRALGVRMAAQLPLERLETLQQLESAINAALDQIAWGQAHFIIAGEDVVIRHVCFPDLPADDAARPMWIRGFSAALEGLYGEWLRAQEAPAQMKAQFLGEKPSTLELRLGYAA